MKEKLLDFYGKNKKAVYIGSAVLAVLLIGIIILLVSCGNGKNGGTEQGEDTTKTPSNYTITLQSEGGMVFSKVNVYVYEDSTLAEMVAAGKTDEEGKMSFVSEGASKYVAVLKGVPEGYEVKEYYDITEADAKIVLKTVLNPVDLDNAKFEAGNIMKDFTVTTPDGVEVKLSEVLKEKKAVMLNFFFLACQPCKNEFPFMQEAYSAASDDIAIITLTPVDQDDEAIKKYAEELGLTFYVAKCDSRWEKAFDLKSYPTSVVIDRYGMISLIHGGSITNKETFEAVFNYYKADDYKQQVVRFVEDIINYKGEEGTEENPIGILPDATEFEANVKAEGKLYFEIPKVTNMELKIADENAYVIYEEETYSAKDGVVSVVISAPDTYTPAKFVIGNNAKEDKTFKATLTGVAGTMMNPHAMSIGQFKANVEAGNEQGVYYTYTATENGTLTLKCLKAKDDVKFDITLYNLNTYVNRTLSADANEDGTVSVDVNAGDNVQIIVSTLPNENNEYPAGEFDIEASFVAGEGAGNAGVIDYSVKVTDSNGKAMADVKVTIDTMDVATDSNGIAKITLKEGSYTVNVAAPSGYKVQGTPTLSKDEPNITVVLVSASAKTVKYTVKVTDESGNALAGASVIVGNNITSTDSKGVATVTLAEGTYDVAVSLNGYSVGNGSVSKNSTGVTVKLKKSGTVSNAVKYTVNVVDYNDKALSGVTAVFKKNGTAVGTATSDSNGKVTIQLEKGNYDVILALDGYKYDSSVAKVTSSQTTVTITMVKTTSKSEDVYFDSTGAYYVENGAQYITVPGEDKSGNEGGNAFFLFEPKRSGMYKITISDPSALISYWGGSTHFINEGTFGVEHTNTSLTLNVVEAGPTYVIGVKNTSECIMTVTRTGKAVTEMAWTDYVAKDNISVYTCPAGTLTYVDITKATSEYKLVKGTDGFYHLGTADGPVMMVHLGVGAPYIALSDVIGLSGTGGSNFGKYFYNSSGVLEKKENYTSLLAKYIENMDQEKYVYPLTEDLMYMLKNGGEFRGWWASSGYGNVIYAAKPNLNSEIAWMWACCYIAK